MSSPPRGAVPTRIILRKNRRAILRDLLRDHPAERESGDVAGFHFEAVQESEGMHRHAGHPFRHPTGGPSYPCAFEQTRISDATTGNCADASNVLIWAGLSAMTARPRSASYG